MTNNGPSKLTKFRPRHFFSGKTTSVNFFKIYWTNLKSKIEEFSWTVFQQSYYKVKKWSKRAENGQKRAKNVKKHFFWKKLFCYFFITYQELTRCKKSKNSNERILRSGERTNERTDGRTELRRQIYRTNLQSRWVQK